MPEPDPDGDFFEQLFAEPAVADPLAAEVEDPAESTFDIETERLKTLGEAQARLGRGKEAAAKAAAIGLYKDKPTVAEWSPEFRSTVERLGERGLLPPHLVEESARIESEQSFLPDAKDIGKFIGKSFLGSLPVIGPAAKGLELAASEYEEQQKPRTMRDPTVLSTALDVLETPQRVGVVAPIEIGRGDRPDEEWYETVGKAFALPSWKVGEEPRDAISLYRRMAKEQGVDPDGWGHVAAGIGLSILTDPTTYTGFGAVRKAATMVGVEQATAIARRTLAAKGLHGATLDQATASFGRGIAHEVIRKGSLENARGAVRRLYMKTGATDAVRQFDDLGASWGKVGFRVGLPLTEGHEVVSHKTLRKLREKVGGPAKTRTKRAAELATAMVHPDDLTDLMARARQSVDPTGLHKGHPDLRAFSQGVAAIRDVPEHQGQVLAKQINRVMRLLTGGYKHGRKVMDLDTGELLSFAKDPKAAMYAQGELGGRVLDAPYALALERRELLQPMILDPNFDKAEVQRAIEHGYAKAIIYDDPVLFEPSKKFDVTERSTFQEYVTKALSNLGMSEDLIEDTLFDVSGRVAKHLKADIDTNKALWNALDDSMRAAMEFHGVNHAKWLAKEQADYRKHAVVAAKRAKNIAMSRGENASKAYKETYERVMNQAPEALDQYMMHVIRNKKNVRKIYLAEYGPAMEQAGKKRQFLSIVENYQHGQDPVLDFRVAMQARAYSHVRHNARMEATELVFDSRWATHSDSPRAAGKTVQLGWQQIEHPFTKETYFVRPEVGEWAQRMLLGYEDPGLLEKMAREFHDPAMGLWKAYVTHGRPIFYNMRNMIDDGWRMWMGGYRFLRGTGHNAFMMSMLGGLEAKKVKQFERRVRGKSRKIDATEDWWHNKLQQWSQQRIKNAIGQDASWQDIYDAAGRFGVLDKGYAAVELSSSMTEGVASAHRFDPHTWEFKQFAPHRAGKAVLGSGGVYLKHTGKIANFAENQRRMSLFLDRWKQGDTFEEASRAVKTWLFDYKDLSLGERQTLRRVMPFWNFLRRSVPAHLHGMRKNPGRYLGVAKTKRGVEEKAESEYGPVMAVREYLDDLFAVRLPMETKRPSWWDPEEEWKGSPVFLSTGLSMTDLNVLGSIKEGVPIGESELFDRLTPVIDLFSILAMDKHPRTGRKLAGDMMEPDPVLRSVVRAYNTAMPKSKEILVLPKTSPTGKKYEVIPASVVQAWRKISGNVVAVQRAISPREGDPFDEEQAPYRRFKELTGLSVMVNNQNKAETDEIYRALHRGFAPVVEQDPDAVYGAPVE